MRVLGIDHIGIAVDDMEAAVRFYQERFGLTADPVEEKAVFGVRVDQLFRATRMVTSG